MSGDNATPKIGNIDFIDWWLLLDEELIKRGRARGVGFSNAIWAFKRGETPESAATLLLTLGLT